MVRATAWDMTSHRFESRQYSPPSKVTSGHRRGRLTGVLLVKLFYQSGGVDIFFWLPRVIFGRVAFPPNQVLQFSPVDPGVMDLCDNKFFLTLYPHGWWRGRVAACEGVLHVWLEEGAVEDRVHPNGVRKVKPERNLVDLCGDLERTHVFLG